MPKFQGMINSIGFGTELIYAFVIIIACLMIYFGTRELYKLTSHKGIKYFRESFLFFALAFFFRSFVKIAFLLFETPRAIPFNPQIFSTITTLLFIYFSTLAIFYLIYSMLWKKLKKTKFKDIFLHVLAGIIAFAIIFLHNSLIYLIVNAILFFVVILSIIFIQSKKKKNKLKIIYVLLSVFLFLNIMDILTPNFLQLFQILIYLFSISIFLWILYKVLTRVGKK